MTNSPDVATAVLTIERLCRHHRVDQFNSTSDEMNLALRAYYNNLDNGEETVVFVAVRVDAVVGFVAIADFQQQDASGAPKSLYLFISALAVDALDTNRWIATRLLKKISQIAHRRMEQQRRMYVGVLTIDLGDISAFLRRAGFEELSGNALFLWRAIGPA